MRPSSQPSNYRATAVTGVTLVKCTRIRTADPAFFSESCYCTVTYCENYEPTADEISSSQLHAKLSYTSTLWSMLACVRSIITIYYIPCYLPARARVLQRHTPPCSQKNLSFYVTSRKINKFKRKFQQIERKDCWFYASKIICLLYKHSLLTTV